MKKATRDKIDRYCSRSLGCKPEDIKESGSGIYARSQTTDYNMSHSETDIDVFVKNGGKIISCSPQILPKVQKLEEHLPGLEVSKDSLQKKGFEVEEVLGPAFLGFTNDESFKPVDCGSCRRLEKEDEEKLSELKEAGDDREISDSIEGDFPEEDVMYGKFLDRELIAVSSFEVWDGFIAFISVFVSREYRGKGFGKEVVSKAAENAIENDLIPCYRTLEKWGNSVTLAKGLGFEKYATTYLVKFVHS